MDKMRLIFWVTALAVLSIALAKNTTAKAKPKRQLDSIRTHENLQYSLVLPHSRVQHYRALNNNRRVSHGSAKGKLPPYAVQMEPVVQYSQKDPLYDPTQENAEETVVNKNEIYAQSKILNVDQSGESYGPPFGTLPTAPLYSHHPHYYEEPEPIIEIIIKESNESLPAPPPPPPQKKKKEPVHVFYVKYSKDPHSKDKVIYEKPVPAITPPTNDEDEHHEHEDEYVTVTPEPYLPPKTTTLRAIIKPESEVYHSDSSVKVTFGNEGRHYSDRRESSSHSEHHEETAPKPAIAFPNSPPQPTQQSLHNHQIHKSQIQLERSVSQNPQFIESSTRPTFVQHQSQSQYFRSGPQQAQSRIQFQPQHIPNEQQLPRQGPSVSPFRPQPHQPPQQPPQTPRIPFGPTPIFNAAFSNGPIVPHFASPTAQSPVTAFPTPSFPRPSNGPSFHSRVNPSFASRPPFNGPPRTSFHSGPQRPFPSQPKNYFDDPKYLQENYHTITTDQVDPPKQQQLPNRPQQSFGPLSHPSPSPTPAQFQEHRRPPIVPLNQQLPQQRPAPQFTDSLHNKPSISINPSASPFFNLKPSPPLIENNRPPFHQPQPQQQFSFHQGPQGLPRPSPQIPFQQQHSFPGPISPSPSPLPQNQFVPSPSSAPLYNFHPQPSPTPDVFHQGSPSERPFNHKANIEHQQNVGSLVPNGGELVPAISKYEQHITVNGPTSQPFNGLGEPGPSQPTPTPSQQQQYHQLQQQQRHQHEQQQRHQHEQQQRQQQEQQQRQQQQQQQRQQHEQQQRQQQEQQQRAQQEQLQRQHQQQLQQEQQRLDAEQEQVRLQLAHNVQKQQEEIQRLQAQLLQTQQQQQQHQYQSVYQQQVQATSPRTQYIQERARPQPSFATSTASPPYYQSTSRTVEIKPTTTKYVSSTQNSVTSAPETKKEEKKNKPAIELPDEVPDDLRQQLLSSGILDNADISVLDYDKVGDTSLDSLPPDQLANFFSAGGAQQIASSENRPVYVKPNGDSIQSRIDEDIDDDQEFAASENVASYVAPPSKDQAVEMKVVHFNPDTPEGQQLAKEYIKENATQVDPVALNDKRYNRYLPLKVSGNQFPLPDVLKGRKVTSVVVLAPVETEALGAHSRAERSAEENLKGIKFVAGESLQELLKRPTKDNFEKWLEVEKKTATDLQSVVLLVTGDDAADGKEIFMYDIASGNVNKLDGDLSNAFVEAAENNSLSKDIESLAIEGEGTPENFNKDKSDDVVAEGSENVPLYVDLSGLNLDQENTNQVSISSGYSKTKHGRSFRRH
ncbi:bromodomain-containing protein 4 [Spodoptera frugiperda]|uniref:Bromodomain-containing protein 4 n=1 Tax=Spodoptera frugiperda TaxID=7108 RepID=A0A9R0D051_SPOFR|nr:bromodomain-containing protein 4 [Spodoptera frugiperda]